MSHSVGCHQQIRKIIVRSVRTLARHAFMTILLYFLHDIAARNYGVCRYFYAFTKISHNDPFFI